MRSKIRAAEEILELLDELRARVLAFVAQSRPRGPRSTRRNLRLVVLRVMLRHAPAAVPRKTLLQFANVTAAQLDETVTLLVSEGLIRAAVGPRASTLYELVDRARAEEFVFDRQKIS